MSGMRLRRTGAFSGVVSVVILLLPASAASTTPEHISTDLTIAYSLVNDRGTLDGVVNADDIPACVNREIRVYRVKGGPDQLFARTESTRTQYGYGLWGIERDRLPHGKYYAVAAKNRGRNSSGTSVLCGADRTDRVRVD